MTAPVVLLTGATGGIGREAARLLAARGGTAVLPVRDPRRGAKLQRDLARGDARAEVVLLEGDLARFADVRALAAQVRQRFDRLDNLVRNAAVVTPVRTLGEDGHELQWTVNHLAPYLLTAELVSLPLAVDDEHVVHSA